MPRAISIYWIRLDKERVPLLRFYPASSNIDMSALKLHSPYFVNEEKKMVGRGCPALA